MSKIAPEPTSKASPSMTPDAKARVLEILNEGRTLTLATLRADGWPQATMVGYMADDLTLYCAVARTSQKLANIKRDRRVSIAIGWETPDALCGVSMAANAVEVTDYEEHDHVSNLLARRRERAVFSPREPSSAILRLTPMVISLIDLPGMQGYPQLFLVRSETTLVPAPLPEDAGAPVP